MKCQKTAFSFVELIIIVGFLGIFAFIAVPRFNYALISKQTVETTARKIVTDLRLTRRLAISDAANNPTDGFGIEFLGPLSSFTSYEIWNRSTFEEVNSQSIDPDVTVSSNTSRYFRFGPLGTLLAGSDTQIIVSAEGRSFTITINPATGMIKCVEN